MSDIEKIAELYRQTVIVQAVCDIDDENDQLEPSPASEGGLKHDNDAVEAENVVDPPDEVVLVEPEQPAQEEPSLHLSEQEARGSKDCDNPAENDEAVHDIGAEEEEGGEITVVDHMAELHQVIEKIVSSNSAKQITSDFMDHLDNVLVGLRKMYLIVDERRAEMDESSIVSVYSQATNHGFIAQKTLNYLQF